MNRLTIILTFLNEGIEVFNTLKSFWESVKYPLEIILINDGSTDDFDYQKIADDFGARYIKHSEQKGPAVSRNEGVEICSTDYFLLLDAHMRVYQDNWLERIMEELEKEENVLLCCSTLTLDKNAVVNDKNPIGYGAFINLLDLSNHWIHGFDDMNRDCLEIPSVLGASYACSRKYWMKLNGLNGLRMYGFEEQLISLKVWLSGGKCKVLKDVEFGHIFRDGANAPYEIPTMDYYLNQLLIVELFYTEEYKRDFIKNMRKNIGVEYTNHWIEKFKQSRHEVAKEKAYYRALFSRDFRFIIDLNTPQNALK
jgi:glycosyltransferase involved in cell wall biosynthesis